MLVNFSLFLSGGKGGQNLSKTATQMNFIAPPILNPLPNATNSARIVISGKASNGQTIYLYINNKNTNEILVDENGSFTFSENLGSGNNLIKTRAQQDDKKSDFSNTINVIFKNSQPTLEVDSPSDGQSFKKDQNSVNVTGRTDSGVSITVNGFWAVINDNNNFSYILLLQNGDNEIKIVALDQAGNKTEKSLKVNYSQ